MKARGQRDGATLVEAIAVLAVVAVASLIVVNRNAYSRADLAAEAVILRTHLRYVQAMAMANNVATWQLAFQGDRYTLLKDNVGAPLPDEQSDTHTLTPGVTVSSGMVRMNEWGTPNGGDFSVTLSDGKSSETITMQGETGFVQ